MLRNTKSEHVANELFMAILSGDYSLFDLIEEMPDGEAKEFYLAIRKEFYTFIEKRKRLLNKHYRLEMLPDGPARDVELLIDKQFKEKKYDEDVIHRTKKLWQEFIKIKSPRFKDSKPWVAALDYMVREFVPKIPGDSERLTQKQLANEYGVSFNQINLCYRNIKDSVDINYYFSRFDNIQISYHLIKSICKAARKYPNVIGKKEVKKIKAQEAWLDNIYKYASALFNKNNRRKID